MTTVSSVQDSLKLLFSDDYKISDSDYKSLSEILLSNRVSELAFESGLVQIIKLLHETGAKFPISINFLQYLWKEHFVDFNFVKMFIPLIQNGILKMSKVSRKTLESGKILHDISTEDATQEKFVAVYSTVKFDSIYNPFSEILGKYKFALNSFLNEGVAIAPQKVKSFVDRSNRLLQNMNIKISIESYIKDSETASEEINLLISNTSDYDLKNKDIQRLVKKYIGKLNYVLQTEAYKESKDEIFLGIKLLMRSDYKEIPMQLFSLIQDMEVNGVSVDGVD